MDDENVPERRGFPALAHKIAVNPDYEAFIFRKFDFLSARNLLHLESRLGYLEWARPEHARMRIAEKVREILKEYREICCSV